VGGVVVANSGPVPFTSATFQGTLTSEVIGSDPANPFGPGNLTFTYMLTNTGGPESIDRLTVPGWGIPGLLTDASYQAPVLPGNIIPTSFDRSIDPLGNVIGVFFTPPVTGLGAIPPGGTSALVVIQTNSTQFNPSVASMIDGSTAQATTFAPLLVFGSPEPSTLVLGLVGFAGLGAMVRNRMLRAKLFFGQQ
jgi:hypothetical protein